MVKFFNFIKICIVWVLSIPKPKNAKFLTDKETIDKVLNCGPNKLNIIRFGDGEFIVMRGRDIHYQDATKELQNWLEKIVYEYIKEPKSCGYLVCMPNRFVSGYGFKLLEKKLYVRCWSYSRRAFRKKFDYALEWGDAFVFGKNKEKQYSRLWLEKEISRIVLVHNNEKYAIQFEKLYGIKTELVKISVRNAFSELDVIFKEVKSKMSNDSGCLCLVSAGPAGKPLVYKLTQESLMAYDTGHFLDDPLSD